MRIEAAFTAIEYTRYMVETTVEATDLDGCSRHYTDYMPVYHYSVLGTITPTQPLAVDDDELLALDY